MVNRNMDIQSKIKNWIKETLKIENDFVVEHPSDLKNGDYSTNVAMTLSKNLGKNPVEIAKDFAQKLDENKIPEIERIEQVGGFINFYLSKEFFTKSVEEILDKGEKVGENDLYKNAPASALSSGGRRKIIIEHTQPNPFKQFHIGHLMNNAIGESIARITKASGAEVKACSYHGDVGLHVAKAIWGKMEKPELSWGDAYAYGSQNYEDKKERIIEINKKIYEKSDIEINSLYEEGLKFSIKYFDSLYERLDSKLDDRYFESISAENGKRIVLDNIGKIFEKSDGAIVFRGENFEPKTHTRVFINSEGLPTYEAKEIGLAELKMDAYYPYDSSITITANEQDSFFDVVEVAIDEVFPDLKGKLKHLSHGMLKLPSGKMSSRTGDVITAEALIDYLKLKAEAKIATIDRDFSDEEKNNIAEMVAIGAIKYSILRQAIGGDIVFDFDKSISFEGDSGPYLQYTAVRAKSVLEKSKLQIPNYKQILNSNFQTLKEWEVTDLERHLYKFGEVVERAGKEYAPHYIVTYLTELASIFNSFYASNKIIDENNPASPYKIALTQAVAHILKSGLNLLGIKVPERM